MKQTGGKLTDSYILQYQKSPNWKNGKFENLENTNMKIGLQHIPKLIFARFFQNHRQVPKENIPIKSLLRNELHTDSDEIKFVWYGHSVLLFSINNKIVLIDPMFGGDASPIGPIRTARFSSDTLQLIDQLPEIDLVLLTHDHYDHLDLASIEKLKPKTRNYFVALGAERHLLRWGVEKEKVKSFDWWTKVVFEDLEIIFTPARHFSGRGLTDRFKSLWGGWIIRWGTQSIYISGDGGYGEHFKEIGRRYGPFDIAFVDAGQYNQLWHDIHMYPEEAVQAVSDVDAKIGMPIHWAGFSLALHHWKEPAERFLSEANKKGLASLFPPLGKVVTLGTNPPLNTWWREID